jgi:FkbM family methyltransferase
MTSTHNKETCFLKRNPLDLVSVFVKQLSSEDIVFLDCGSNDGCSAIKFLATHPTAKVLSLEPNPDLHSYHRLIPNTLVGCAIGESSGFIDLFIDTVDGDGSTTVPAKRVDATNQFDNKDCPVIHVECIGIEDLLLSVASTGATIVLKLDVEGAEYKIISRLLASNLVRLISSFYCEFHWDRINMPEYEHLEVIENLNNALSRPVTDWDAFDWMINQLSGERRRKMSQKRLLQLSKIYAKRIIAKLNIFVRKN